MKLQARAHRSQTSTPLNPQEIRAMRSGSASAPILTPLALLLLGVVHMARAQRVDRPSAEQAGQESELAAALAAGEAATLSDAAGAPVGSSLDAAGQDLLGLLRTLAEQARAATDALTQPAEAAEGGQGAGGSVAQETVAEQALTQAAADRTGQIDRAQTILETYQSLIEQLPADAVLSQTVVSAPAAAEAAAASSTTLLAGLLGLLALGAAGGGGSGGSGGSGGGGGGGGSTPAPAATEITLHDGYIDGAKVYVDLNDDGSVDANDKLLGTTKDGKLSAVLTDSDKLHGLIAQGGIDISTNSAFIGSFSTTAGSTVINPITTVVQTLVQATVGSLAGLSNEAKAAALEEAKSTAMITVSTALGIEEDVDLTKLDTVKASASTTGDTSLGVQADDAIALHSKALMLSNMISAGAAALAGATGDSTDTAALAKFVVKGIVGSINAAASQGESISFKSSDDVLQVISNAVDAAKEGGKSIDDAIMNDSSGKVAGAVATVNQIINTFAGEATKAAASSGGSAVGGLTQMLQAQKVLNNQVEGLAQNNTSTLNQLNTLADPSAALTQAQAQTQSLKVGTTAVTAVTERPADTVAPTVVDVDVNPARVGDLARVVVKMSEPVFVKADSAPPTLQITTSAAGATVVTATARFDAGLSSPDALVFTYRVQEGDARVAVADGASIALPVGTVIRDLALNNANPAIATGASTDVDTLAPTVGVSTSASFVKAGATALVTFTLSEAASTRSVNGFSAADVTVKNGALSDFTKVSETVYTAKLAATSAAAPAEVGVAGGRFTDQAGNGNKPSNVVTVAQEGAAPVVVLEAAQSFFNSVNSSGTPQTTVKFSLSAPSSDFTTGDVTVSGGGEISNFAGSGKDYTATLTGVTSLTQVKVGKDAFGVTGSTAKNGESNILSFKVDTAKPTVAISVLKGSTGTDAVTANTTLKAGDSARVSFTLSEEGVGFGPQAVKVLGGFLENFAQDKSDPKKFTATFKPAAPEVGKPAAVVEASITVDADRFKDQAGNPNDGASASFKIDNLRPGVVSVTDDQQGLAKVGSTVTYTYTFNKAVTGLDKDDFVASNGTVTNVSAQGSAGDRWTVTVTPAANVAGGNIGLSLKPGVVTDTAGNTNLEHRQAVQGLDTVVPTAPTLNLASGVAGGATLDEARASGGVLTVLAESGASTALSFVGSAGTVSKQVTGNGGTPVAVSLTAADVVSLGNGSVAVSAVATDAAGNASTAATSSFTLDTKVPAISSVTDGTAAAVTKDAISFTVTFDEAISGALGAGSFAATNGTVSSVTQVGSSNAYTVVVAPTPGVASGSVKLSLVGTGLSDAAGNALASAADLASQDIDTKAPAVTALTDATQASVTKDAVTFTVSFDEALVGTVGAGSFSAANGAVTSVTRVGTSNDYSVVVTPTTGVASGAVTLSLVGTGLADAVGNAVASVSLASLGGQNIDTLSPSVVSLESNPLIYLSPSVNGGQVQTGQLKIGFNENIQGLGIDDFEVKFGDVVQSSAVRAATLSDLAGSGKDWTVKFTPPVAGSGGGSSPVADAGAGFVEIENLTLVKGSTTTTVTFDVTFDAATYDAKRIEGFKIDLDYDYAAVTGATSGVTSITIADGETAATWNPIQPNLRTTSSGGVITVSNGQIAGVLDQNYAEDARLIDTTGYTDGSGKVMSVKLVIGSLVDSFEVGLESQASGGDTYLNVAGSNEKIYPEVGITKTAQVVGAGTGTGTDISLVSVTLKGGYTDFAGNAATTSSSPLNLLVNQVNPVLSLSQTAVTAAGNLVFTVQASDPAVSGLGADDFGASNGSVVASSFAAVSGQPGKYTVEVRPSASGDVKLTAAADAGKSGALGTVAAESAAVKFIKGGVDSDTIELTSAREIVDLGGGNDVVRLDSTDDSSSASQDVIAGIGAGDKVDITALLNKAGTQSQYFSVVDSRVPQPVEGWAKAINRTADGSLGTVGDNEIRFIESVDGNRLTLSFVYDADSRVGSTTASSVVQGTFLGADAAAITALLAADDYVIVDKVAPTISVSIDKTTFAKINPGTATVTFTSNEILGALPAASVNVVNGSITAPVQSSANPLQWTATFSPATTANVTAGSISVKNQGYTDGSGNAGAASNTQAVSLNAEAPALDLFWEDFAADGTITFRLESDQPLTGLTQDDFSLSGQTVLTFNKVSMGSALPEAYEGTIKPSASGTIGLSLPAGAAQGASTATLAVTADPASIAYIKSPGTGAAIEVDGPAVRIVQLAAGNETVQVNSVGTGPTSGGTTFMGIVSGVNAGDVLDVSRVLTGYTSIVQPELPDTGAGFVEIENLKLVKGTTTTTVTFDVTFDSATYDAKRIEGFKIDLDYDYAAVTGATSGVTSITIADGETAATWNPIQPNLRTTSSGGVITVSNGQIAGVLDQNYAEDARLIDTTGYTDGSGKVMSVKLVIGSLVDAFRVGLESQADGGDTYLNVAGSSEKFYPEVGIDKTARLAGTAAGPKTGALEVSTTKQTVAAGIDEADYPILSSAPTDNQLKVLQIIESADNAGDKAKYGTLQFQYDTNPAAGTTVLSPIVEVAMVSTDIAAFFESNYAKLI